MSASAGPGARPPSGTAAGPVLVKVCGLTSVEDALACVDAGASSLGVNLIPASKRCVPIELARRISRAVGTRALVVGIVADLGPDALRRARDDGELGCLQLHGHESPSDLAPLLPHAYKAVRVAGPADVAAARRFPGEYLLVDTKVDGALGGTGRTFDWSLVVDLARERRLTLAGGLTPDNVARAVALVRPFCVDVAGGVERTAAGARPGEKDLARVRAFVAAAHASS